MTSADLLEILQCRSVEDGTKTLVQRALQMKVKIALNTYAKIVANDEREEDLK